MHRRCGETLSTIKPANAINFLSITDVLTTCERSLEAFALLMRMGGWVFGSAKGNLNLAHNQVKAGSIPVFRNQIRALQIRMGGPVV